MNQPESGSDQWARDCIAAVDRFRATDPDGWADYLKEFEVWDAIPNPPLDPWEPGSEETT